MKSIVVKVLAAVPVGLFGLAQSVMAGPCVQPGAPNPDNYPLCVNGVPEPSALSMIALGVAGAVVVARFMSKK